MRTLTTAQDAVLSLPYRSVHLKVSLKPSGGTWTDMTDLEGYNWVQGVSYGSGIDQYVSTATVSLWAKRDHLNLAPLVTGSKLNTGGNLCDVGSDVKVETATIAVDAEPQTTDWVTVFVGSVDVVEWQSNPIKLMCRDEGATLDKFIETQAKYPADPLTEANIEDVIQEILDAEFGTITLYSKNGTAGTPWNTSDSPGWVIREYLQQKQSVQQALRVLADQIGWQLRYEYQTDTADFELMLYDIGRPMRARGTITHTGQPTVDTPAEKVTVNTTDYEEGVDWEIGSTTLETAQNIAAAINATSGVSSWALDATKAEGTMSFTGVPSAAESFTLNGTAFVANTDYTIVAGDTEGTIDNIVVAINASAESSNLTAYKRANNAVVVQWLTAGSAGDAITFTESLSNCTFNGSGTLGGSRAGRDVRTIVEWDTAGTAGNSIVFTETLSNATADGSGTLGGTVAGTSVSSARTFSASDYYDISAINMRRDNVRNKVKVRYGYEKDTQSTVTVQDSTSQTRYGVRYCEITEAGSSQIDTESEARTLANSVLDDLKEPDLIKSVSMPYFFAVQLGDSYTFSANGVHYDADQTLAVTSYQHDISADGKAVTTLQCQGKPSSGLRRWLRLEARPGIGKQNIDYTYDSPSNIQVTPGMSSFEVSFDDPRTRTPPFKDWKFTRLYLDTSSGFTANTSTLHETYGPVTRFVVTGLIPGTTYYTRIKIEDALGNVSYASPEAVVTTQYSSPYHTNTDALVARNSNPDFGTRTVSTTMPDNWQIIEDTGTAYTGVFDTDVFYDSTVSLTGGKSIKFFSNTSGRQLVIESELIPASYLQSIAFETYFQFTGTPGSGADVRIGYRAYDEDKVFVNAAAKQLNLSGLSASTWYSIKRYAHPSNSSTRYVSAYVQLDSGTTSLSNLYVYIDKGIIAYASPRFEMYDATLTAVATGGIGAGGTWTQIGTTNTETNSGFTTTGTPNIMVVQKEGSISLTAATQLTAANNSDVGQLRFKHVSGGSTVYYYSPVFSSDNAGAGLAKIYMIHKSDIIVTNGDQLSVEAAHTNGGSLNTQAGRNNTFTTGYMVEAN